ncbi:hypothetical protein CGRA01v4_10256 [Colletotrichum graminicola]|nr:hypothetical protein CGRA01v4_10256 [Colletotrichum graminicola]
MRPAHLRYPTSSVFIGIFQLPFILSRS